MPPYGRALSPTAVPPARQSRVSLIAMTSGVPFSYGLGPLREFARMANIVSM